jgi:flavin reductase ActVB
VTTTAQRMAAAGQAAANRSSQRETPVSAALKLITNPGRESASGSDFADAMSTLASGVVLVTSWVGGRPWGMTVTAFTSVSADPPTVLVSLRSDTATARAIAETSRFGVSILAADQVDVAAHASVPAAPKFLEAIAAAGGAHCGSPAVAGALAHLDCELAHLVEAADHSVFFGRVRTAARWAAHPPLLYHRRRYRTLLD